LALAVLAAVGVARADIVHLKNGRTMQGTVEEDTGKTIVLKTESGRVTLMKTQIASIEKEEPKPADSEPGAAGAAPVASGSDTVAIVRLIRAEKFGDAERALETIRALGRDRQSDETRLSAVVGQLGKMASLRPLLDKWCASAPRSWAARVVRGDSCVESAWEARGTGWAQSVQQEGWKLFRERLAQAKDDLEVASHVDARDSYAPSRLVTVARGLDLSEDAIEQYVSQAVAADPRCFNVYLTRVWSLKPRWGGTNELMFAFARKAAQDHPDDPAIAMAIVAAHEDFAEYTIGQMGKARDKARAYLEGEDVKKEIDDILDRVLAKYPKAGWACSRRANLARIGGDAEGRLKWLRRAAELGDASGANELAVAYEQGQGVAKNDAEALKWLARAAALGHPVAISDLGWHYDSGTGVAADPARAVALYREAAELDDGGGTFNLACCYHRGTGVEKDEAESLRLLQRAADLGLPRALFALGYAYAKGDGVPVDKAKAKKLLEAAAAKGSQEAKALLPTLKD
jgi:hypothetical protein